MSEEKKTVTADPAVIDKVDSNGDGHISHEEMEMNLEFKRKELEDADARRDAMRKMTWFALMGMLLYPAGIFVTSFLGQEKQRQLSVILHRHTLLQSQRWLQLTLVQTHTQIRRSR